MSEWVLEDGDWSYGGSVVCTHHEGIFRVAFNAGESYGDFDNLDDAKAYIEAKENGTETNLVPKPFDIPPEGQVWMSVGKILRGEI